jgi:hypothetical protein
MLAMLLASFAAVIGILRPDTAGAQERTRCFAETNQCISGVFLDYWERNGGLAVFGYPITPVIPNELVEDTWVGRTQWFERDRLEDHGDQGVMAGRLGARILELRGQSWWDFPQVSSGAPGCAYFPETRHSLCEPFLSYWRNNGGLERFGYPISEPRQETVENWTGTVQHFERRRMEHHTEFAGTPYEVLLGRLGAETLAISEPTLCTGEVHVNLRAAVAEIPFRDVLGCPTTIYEYVPAAVQTFEHGRMVWVDLGDDGKHIYVVKPELQPGYDRSYARYDDPWQEGDPEELGVEAPEGMYAPKRGFGQIWWRHYRRGPVQLGWATEPEHAERAVAQAFSSGAMVMWVDGQNVYAFGPDRLQVSIFRRP